MILAIETATAACSAAVADEDGRLLAHTVARAGPAHTRRLLADIHHALEMAGVAPEGIATVLVSLGPGTFTGLRIGVATARALAHSSDARLIGVPTLAALACAMAEADAARASSRFVAAVDGKRQEVFVECFARAAAGPGLVAADPLQVLRATDLGQYLERWPGAVLGGDGAHLYAAQLPANVHLSQSVIVPTAAMVLRAWLSGVPGITEGLAHTVPIYGREPDAVRWIDRAARARGGQAP